MSRKNRENIPTHFMMSSDRLGRKFMKRKIELIGLVLLLTVSLTGCGIFSIAKKISEAKDRTEQEARVEKPEKTAEPVTPTPSPEALITEPMPEEGEDLYAMMADWGFEFCSGAGGWSTNLSVNPDGSFEGDYHDTDYGDIGTGYPNGTVYLCSFYGKFGNYEKITDHVYEVMVDELTYDTEPDTEDIEEGQRFIYTDAYGISGTDILTVYLPGTEMEDLPEEYLEWITMTHFYTYLSDGGYERDLPMDLPFCGIYNEAEDCAFYSYSGTDRNMVYLKNRATFPGIRNEECTLNSDGTYLVRDMDPYGMVTVTNLCYPSEGYYSTYKEEDMETLAKEGISHVMGKEDFRDLYTFGYGDEDMFYLRPLRSVNGEDTLYVMWTSGGNEDTRDFRARMFQKDGYTYVYAIGISQYGDEYREAVNRFLSSLSISGVPDDLTCESEHTGIRRIFAFVNNDFDTGRDTSYSLSYDEGEIIGCDETDKLRENGFDPEEVYEDFVIVGDDGDYVRCDIAEDCMFYFENIYDLSAEPLYLTTDELWQTFVWEGHDWAYDDGKRLMYLFLDDRGQVVFAYEPYLG